MEYNVAVYPTLKPANYRDIELKMETLPKYWADADRNLTAGEAWDLHDVFNLCRPNYSRRTLREQGVKELLQDSKFSMSGVSSYNPSNQRRRATSPIRSR